MIQNFSITKHGLPILSLILFLFTLYWVFSYKPLPKKDPIVQPASSSFANRVSGIGVIEPASEIISIGTSIAGIVQKIHVQVGDKVEENQPLFTIDDRDAKAQLALYKAKVQTIKVQLADNINQLNMFENVSDKRAVSQDELKRHRFAVESSKAQLAEAEAQIGIYQTTLDRLTVKSPINGEVLKMDLRVGEYAQTTGSSDPLIQLGNIDSQNVRVKIDETEIDRIKTGGRAYAISRDNTTTEIPLTFIRIENLAIPKSSLTGDGRELIDTRVIELLYALPKGYHILSGQQVDVFIEANSK